MATTTINPKFALGCIYCRDTGISIEKIRIIGIQNDSTVKYKNLDTNFTGKICYKTLIDNWYLLYPDGYLVMSIVGMNENNDDVEATTDVVASFFTSENINKAPYLPDCVCRQNINNVFDVIKRTRSGNTPNLVGCCMSQETCPADMDYNLMLACDSVKESAYIGVYRTDSLDDILGCFRTNKYDTELYNIHHKYENYIAELYKDTNGFVAPQSRFYGYSDTLKELLVENDFMYELRRALYITQINFILEFEPNSEDKLSEATITNLSKEFGYYIINPICIEYDRDIDLDKIADSKEKMMVADSNDKIYLIVYEKGSSFIG